MAFEKVQGTERVFFAYHQERIEEQVFCDMLKQSTYTIQCLTLKKEIVDSIQVADIDIALVSIHIPFMDPYELCYQLSLQKKSLPILMIASSPDSIDIPKAFAMGISDIIYAPYIKPLIWVRIETYLRLYKLECFIKTDNCDQYLQTDAQMEAIKKELTEKKEKRKCYQFTDTRVLLAEDNEMNQQLMKNILESSGIQVEIVKNGQEAIDQVLSKVKGHSQMFDAILMDIQMPVVNGFSAAQKIQQFLESSHQPEVPIIAITAHTMSNSREKCLRAGMVDYLAKPIDPERCLNVVSQWIHSDKISQSSEPSLSDRSSDISFLEEKIPGLNIKIGLKRAAGNEKLYKNMLSEFYEDYQHTSQRLLDLKKENKINDLRIMAHTLKGLGGNIGAEFLQNTAFLLEESIKTKVEDKIQASLQQLVNTIDTLLSFIKQYLPFLKEKEPSICHEDKQHAKEINFMAMKSELNNLYQYLDQGRTNAIDHFNPLFVLITEEFPDHVDPLKTFIHSYDYEKAQEMIIQITNKIDDRH
ncbi:MAG: response regulator [Candidatus Magnetomorum sp.]|nr:response regulator [Candidatus Magnetomorum sp.]